MHLELVPFARNVIEQDITDGHSHPLPRVRLSIDRRSGLAFVVQLLEEVSLSSQSHC